MIGKTRAGLSNQGHVKKPPAEKPQQPTAGRLLSAPPLNSVRENFSQQHEKCFVMQLHKSIPGPIDCREYISLHLSNSVAVTIGPWAGL